MNYFMTMSKPWKQMAKVNLEIKQYEHKKLLFKWDVFVCLDLVFVLFGF